MTDDQLRALIVQCGTLPDGRIEIDRSAMAAIARDALRFWWLIENGETDYNGDDRDELRAAIDADMEASR